MLHDSKIILDFDLFRIFESVGLNWILEILNFRCLFNLVVGYYWFENFARYDCLVCVCKYAYSVNIHTCANCLSLGAIASFKAYKWFGQVAAPTTSPLSLLQNLATTVGLLAARRWCFCWPVQCFMIRPPTYSKLSSDLLLIKNEAMLHPNFGCVNP